MDAQLKAKWVKALRSGEYEQTKHELECDGAFCCLGVLCKVGGIDLDDVNVAYHLLEGITGDYGPLVGLNDVDGKSFNEIADYIEVHL
jgi:hypothetical protein